MNWRSGILKEDLTSVGGSVLKKDSIVKYLKCREYNNGTWTNNYEWHYRNMDNTILIRTSEFLIKQL